MLGLQDSLPSPSLHPWVKTVQHHKLYGWHPSVPKHEAARKQNHLRRVVRHDRGGGVVPKSAEFHHVRNSTPRPTTDFPRRNKCTDKLVSAIHNPQELYQMYPAKNVLKKSTHRIPRHNGCALRLPWLRSPNRRENNRMVETNPPGVPPYLI